MYIVTTTLDSLELLAGNYLITFTVNVRYGNESVYQTEINISRAKDDFHLQQILNEVELVFATQWELFSATHIGTIESTILSEMDKLNSKLEKVVN